MTRNLLYRDGDSALHRLDPGIKLCLLAWVMCSLFVYPWPVLLGIDLLLLIWAWCIGLGAFVSLRLLAIAAPFAVALSVIHATLLPAADSQPVAGVPWTMSYSPTGLHYALLIASRFVTFLSASLLFVASTHPLALLRSLECMGAPTSLSYLLTSPMLLIEQFSRRSQAIRDSQQTRGLNVQGSWLIRMSSLPSLFIPLVTLALADTAERAQLLEARGFRHGVARPAVAAGSERLLRYLIVAIIVLQSGLALCL